MGSSALFMSILMCYMLFVMAWLLSSILCDISYSIVIYVWYSLFPKRENGYLLNLVLTLTQMCCAILA